MNPQRKLIRAAMIVDGIGVRAAPGAILVDGEKIEAAGAPQEVGEVDCPVLDLPDAVVVPATVNVHAHLDLTHMGPRPLVGGFARWADAIRTGRCLLDHDIAQSVRQGVELSRRGGTAAIGDIGGAGSAVPLRALRASGMAGVSFLEVFGLGRRQSLAVELMQRAVAETPALANGVRLGLQPHAPYSCGLGVFQAAATLGVPLSTHLAESLEELSFVANASGDLADMVRRIGVWDDTIMGTNLHPVDYVMGVLHETPLIAAHLNYVEMRHLTMLVTTQTTVAYCPRASAYFGHPAPGYPPHRYLDMLDAGINVALGTDSIVCLDTADRLSVLDDMRFLHRRNGVDPTVLLRMGTVNGAAALGIDPALVTLAPGETAGLLSLRCGRSPQADPLRSAMMNDDAPQWVLGPITGHDSWHVQRPRP